MNEELEQLKDELNNIYTYTEYLYYEMDLTDNERKKQYLQQGIDRNQELYLYVFDKISKIEAEINKAHKEKNEILKEITTEPTIKTTTKRGKKL